MPDPIWLDNNIVDRAWKGDVDVRNKLAEFRGQGRKLLIVPWVRNEFIEGDWTADTGTNPKGKYTPPVGERGMPANYRAQAEAFLKEQGIETDMAGDKIENKKRQSYIWETRAPTGEVSNKDRMVLGQIKASAEARGVANPQVYTAEQGGKGMASQTKGWGITSIVHAEPPKPPVAPKPPAKPPVGGSGGSGAAGGTPPAGGPPPATGGTGSGTAGAKGAVDSPGKTAGKSIKASSRTLAPKPPKIDLADYPPERPGRVTRFFNDRPALKKAGLIGGGAAISYAQGKLYEAIEKHFAAAVEEGAKEFHKHYPSAASLKQAANLDALRQPINALLADAMRATRRGPPDPKAFGKDRVAGLRALVAYLKGVKADKNAVRSFDKAAHAYVDAMGEVVEKLAALRIELDPIAEDVERRAGFLGRTGTYLEDLFWEVVPVAVAVPVAYYQWLDVYNLAGLFNRLGVRVGGLAGEIRGVAASYDREIEALYAELQAVSEALAAYAPNGS